MEPVEIAAGRLQLRPWQPYDLEEYLAAVQDPEVPRWTTVPEASTREQALEFLTERSPRGWTEGDHATWAAREAVTGDLVGAVGLHRIGDGTAELGYWTAAAFRGRGLTTEACAAACRWGFGALGLEVVTWNAQVGNWGSRAVAEKLGFTIEGVRRKGLSSKAGPRVDGWTGSLLATDEMTDRRPLPARVELTDGVVTLRRWRSSDAADVARACDDLETARWLPVPVPYAPEDGAHYVEVVTAQSWAEGSAMELAITDAATGELLGACGLKLHARALNGVGEIGYWTAPWARGRGVAGRAARLSSSYGLEHLGLARVELLADVDNAPSQRAAEKAGFLREGVSRRARRVRAAEPRDMVLFSRV